MKNTYKFALFTLILISLFFIYKTSRSEFVSASSSTGITSPAQQDATPTSQVKDQSVIGSTNGILVMGFVITIIAITPLIIRKKRT